MADAGSGISGESVAGSWASRWLFHVLGMAAMGQVGGQVLEPPAAGVAWVIAITVLGQPSGIQAFVFVLMLATMGLVGQSPDPQLAWMGATCGGSSMFSGPDLRPHKKCSGANSDLLGWAILRALD